MEHNGILIGSILAMLAASLVATYFGHSLIGFILFVFALTPVPVNAAHWLRGLAREDGAGRDAGGGTTGQRTPPDSSKQEAT